MEADRIQSPVTVIEEIRERSERAVEGIGWFGEKIREMADIPDKPVPHNHHFVIKDEFTGEYRIVEDQSQSGQKESDQ